MAPANDPRNSSGLTEEQLARLAEQNSYGEPSAPPASVASDGFFWKLVDTIGPWSAIAAAGIAALAVLLAWLGGESYSWAGYFYLPVTLLLILYIPYLLRRRQQEKITQYLLRQQAQEKARLEVARIVLEQSQKDKTNNV